MTLTSCYNRTPKLGGGKQQACIVSEIWRPEVQNQGVGEATFLPKALGLGPLVSSSSFLVALGIPQLWLHPAHLCLCGQVASLLSHVSFAGACY